MRSVVSLDPDIAVFASDIFRHRTVEVWPRRVNWGNLAISVSYDDRVVCRKIVPSRKIPHAHVAIASTADQKITPRHHGPYAHDVSLERLLVIAYCVENMYLRIVERNHNVLVRQMQTGYYTLIWGNLPRVAYSSIPPCRLNHVSLLEMRSVCGSLLFPLGWLPLSGSIEALRPETLSAAS